MKIFSSPYIACLAVGVNFLESLPPAGQTLRMNVIGSRSKKHDAYLLVFPHVDGGYVKNLQTGLEAVWFGTQLEQTVPLLQLDKIQSVHELVRLNKGDLYV